MRIKLKIRRLEKRLSQEELANKVELSSQSISNYETGKATPTYAAMKRIADTLDSTVDELFSEEAKI